MMTAHATHVRRLLAALSGDLPESLDRLTAGQIAARLARVGDPPTDEERRLARHYGRTPVEQAREADWRFAVGCADAADWVGLRWRRDPATGADVLEYRIVRGDLCRAVVTAIEADFGYGPAERAEAALAALRRRLAASLAAGHAPYRIRP